MRKAISIAILLFLFQGCFESGADMKTERKNLAKQWIRGEYCSDPAVIDDLAGDDVIISYPIFEAMFGVPVIRGRNAVKDFAKGFSSRWSEPEVAFHEVIAEGNRVVLIWSFRGVNISTPREDQSPTNREHNWGGITLIRFNDAGKIIEEIGEESEPGPFERISGGGESGTTR